jgi:hypothetical protein
MILLLGEMVLQMTEEYTGRYFSKTAEITFRK